MKQVRNHHDELRLHSDGTSRNFEAGWRGRWFGIHFPDLAQADIRVVAISTAIVAATVIIGFAVVWDRVSTLWR